MEPTAPSAPSIAIAGATLDLWRAKLAWLTPDDAHLAACLSALVAAGRAAWPSVDLDPDVFLAYVWERLGAGVDPRTGLRPADLFVACACAHGDARAIAALDKRFLGGAAAFLRHRDDAPGFVDDVLQDLRLKVFVGDAGAPPRISEYLGTGSLEAWLRVAAVRGASNLRLRARREIASPDVGDGGARDPLADAQDPELVIFRAQHRLDFDAAFADALAGLEPSDRTLLRLYLIDRLNIAEIGAIIDAHRATVARKIAAARAKLLADTRQNLMTRLGVGAGDIDSVVRLLQSQLDVSLFDYLRG